MSVKFVPCPRRCNFFNKKAAVTEKTEVILQMPSEDSRLTAAAKKLFSSVETAKGSYALFSKGSFAPAYAKAVPQGYLLSIHDNAVQIGADDAAGLFYGMQTLRQWLLAPEKTAVEILDWPELSLRSDYLDMRGLFPKYERLLEYIGQMAEFKLNTLVIEYEDKLPRSRTEFCHPVDTLTKDQHKALLKTAYDNFIDVIPLQQTFGHLEYALKLPEYQHLRELPETPGEMCPLRDGAFELAAKLIEETAMLHPDSRYLHLGCDEVWSLGKSPECIASGKSRGQISIEFINRLAEKTLELGKIPVVWHDMLANVWQHGEMGEAQDYNSLASINKNIVVAIWLYSPDRVNRVAPKLIEKLDELGIRSLPCCAVRASDRSGDQNYPRIEQRLRNIDSWCELIEKTRCTGMINTNWCSTFSLGNPYGLFETSRYTAFYAAERSWNMSCDTTDYLERFLAVFHGVYNAVSYGGAERRYDYYTSMSHYIADITRNIQTARLIDIMFRLEYTASVNYMTFRGDYFKDSEVEMTCLRERAVPQYKNLKKVEDELKALLPDLMTQGMSDMFFESRSYPNRLYKRELERILKITL